MLPSEFYDRPTLLVARELLGKMLVHHTEKGTIYGMIVEVESYIGPEDQASHAVNNRKTERTRVMFEDPGTMYVYQIYGQNNCVNIVTEKNGYPAAILIRAVEPFHGLEIMMKNRKLKKPDLHNIASGPGKVCQSFDITKSHNETTINDPNLFIEDFIHVSEENIMVSPRINVDYAGDSKDNLYRFFIKDNEFISAKSQSQTKKTFADLIASYTQSVVAKS